MKPRPTVVMIAITLLAGCTGSPERVQPPSPSPSTTSTTTPTETPLAGPRAVAIVSSVRGDLVLFDVATNAARRLTRDGEEIRQTRPRFRDSNTVTYLQEGVVFDIDTDGGAARRVFKEGDEVRAFDWSPDGRSLAAIVLRGTSWRLSIMTPADGKVRDVKTVAIGPFGRGGVDEDEVRIDWSPDGTKILVVDTGALEGATQRVDGPTMLVVGTDGSEPIERRRGTFARWSLDGTTVFYVDFGGDGRLRAVDVATGTVTPLAATAPVRRPALAPVGTLIAYDDGNPATSVSFFNAATGATRRLGAGAGALWLGTDAVVVTPTRPCSGDECAEGPQWVPLTEGTTNRLGLDGTATARNAAGTLDADVRYA